MGGGSGKDSTSAVAHATALQLLKHLFVPPLIYNNCPVWEEMSLVLVIYKKTPLLKLLRKVNKKSPVVANLKEYLNVIVTVPVC